MPEGHETRWWWEEKATTSGIDLSWPNILSKWDAIETDFHHFYSTDLADGTLGRRTWRWFRIRLVRLLAEETSLARQLGLLDIRKPPDKEG